MAVRAVFLDVGETLVDERRYWAQVARLVGVEEHALWAALGVAIHCGQDHRDLYRHLGVERPSRIDSVVYHRDDLYPDALPCLEALRAAGYVVGAAGNQSHELEAWLRAQELPIDVIGSSASWRARKPERAFFEHMVDAVTLDPGQVAYVGDRVDNDVEPAAAAGLVAVHLRRGPWGRLQAPSASARVALESLAELPQALGSLG
jgi:HAD superfamily hydrolase (TIGR01662 family)